MEEFSRIQRLPPYVFNITDAMKKAARHRGEDIIDFGMGNPDGATPRHIVEGNPFLAAEAYKTTMDANRRVNKSAQETIQRSVPVERRCRLLIMRSFVPPMWKTARD